MARQPVVIAMHTRNLATVAEVIPASRLPKLRFAVAALGARANTLVIGFIAVRAALVLFGMSGVLGHGVLLLLRKIAIIRNLVCTLRYLK